MIIKRILTILFILIFVFLASFSSFSTQNDVNAQIILPTITIIFPTATRTPTPINVGNFVWDDLDHDGRQDIGEPGLPNITVQLWNGAKTQLIDSTTTNSNGNYTLIAPTPGDYRIRVVLPGFFDSFSPKDQAAGDDLLDSDINPSGTNLGFTDIYTFGSNLISITTIDAGIIVFRTPTPTRTPTPVNIGNFVWDDLDHDGRQDAGEPGIPGVTVQLWNTAKTQLIHSTMTNATGNYFVIAPTPGDYRIRVVLPNISDSFSPKNQAGGDDQLDSDINPSGSDMGFTDIFTIASNVISTTLYDAGIIIYRTPTPTRTQTPINLGNFVWHDLNGNGIQDAGEPGIGGIPVQLWNNERTIMFDSTITNSNGNYTLIAPIPGDYRIRVIKPAGSSYSPTDQGANDNLDSDILSNIFLLTYGYTTTISIASNVISISNIDAGLMNVSPSPTPTLTPTRTPIPENWSEVFLPLLLR
ncbi:MAG: SdrD B-like domain-containing protein [Anaerolineaceae bacterium]